MFNLEHSGGDFACNAKILSCHCVYNAKIFAVILPLDIITINHHKKFIIFTDSLSALIALKIKTLLTLQPHKYLIKYIIYQKKKNSDMPISQDNI